MLVGASYCMDICWERKRRKFLMKLNKIDKATDFIFSPCFLFIQFKRILYLKIRIFFSADIVVLVLETPTLCMCVRMFMFVQMWTRSLISRFMK